MESLKPILLLVVLGGVGYGVYVALNHAPRTEPAGAPSWNKDGSNASGDRASTGVKPAVGTDPRESSASEPWKDSATSAPRSQALWTNQPPTSSLPFGVGSANIRSTGSDPMLRSNAPSVTATGIAPVDMGADREASHPSPSTASDSQSLHDYEAARRAAQTLLAQGKLVEALRELSRWYDHPAVPAHEQSSMADLLSQLAGTVIYSRQPWLAPSYVVKAGDSLESIAAQHQVPWQVLAKINGIESPQRLIPGDELKMLRGPFHAQFNRQQDRLTLFIDGLYAGRFRVEGGRDVMKPDGTYPVAKFAADHPANVMRRPYISLGGDLHISFDGPTVVGNSGPTALRISQPDMNELFDMLSERSQITIRR